MNGMHYNKKFPAKRVVEVAGGGFSSPSAKFKKNGSFTNYEPISVLDTRSPSPSTSTSTFSSFNTTTQQGSVAIAAAADDGGDGGRKEDVMADLQPGHNTTGLELTNGVSENFHLGVEDWESLLSESEGQDSLLRWISTGDVDESSLSLKQLLLAGNSNETQGNVGCFGAIDSAISPVGNVFSGLNTSAFGLSGCGFSLNVNNNGKIGQFSNSINDNNSKKLLSLPNGMSFHNQQYGNLEQKAQIFSPRVGLQQLQVQNALNLNPLNLNSLSNGSAREKPLHYIQPPLNFHNPSAVEFDLGFQNATVPFLDPLGFGQQPNFVPLHQLQQKPMLVPKQEVASGSGEQMVAPHCQQLHQQNVNDQLYKAAELILAGNFSNAQGILARLNQVLSPIGKPFQRTAFYLKEALHLALLMPNMGSPLPRIPTPFDVMFKMGAYKIFSEVSPLVQFMNFTANQVILEALDNAEEIHIIDFDIGFGAQWSSFMQELPRSGQGAPSLKITAFASPSTHHAVELSLMHENLTQFANDLHVNFNLEVMNIDSFDPNSNSLSSFRSSKNETIVVNFPIWSMESHLSVLPSLLCFIKKLSPKIMVSLDRGCDRTDLPFSGHILNSLQYYEALLNSIEATNMASDSINKVEKFLFQPRIETTVLGRLRAPNLMPPWSNLFASAGFFHTSISNFAETQAECVVKRSQVKGFHVEKQRSSLVLCWQHHALMSVTAWRC
ncbi:scarecrow-like protein 27 isoform X1 [Olea europaea var. sylvestris]|uniref:scarecrow-like protein 27 isoform X1 n=1 Tax=Olea europaea var. sylvestris TaxID=158386 RepID=UPI000C1CE9C7|nr:scarecrow-like protein 27 isoform X1 [Olea europaea var. sylvestris]